MTTATSLLLTVIGACLSLVGTLIVLNLRSIKKCVSNLVARIDGVESDHKRLARDFVACKVDSERSYVSKEDWVRSEAKTRDKLDTLVVTLSRMEGKLQVVEKLPEIAGAVAREIVSQLDRKKGGPE